MANSPVTPATSPLLAFVSQWPDATRHTLTQDGDWARNIQPALAELAKIIALEPDATIRLSATRLFMECLYCHARTRSQIQTAIEAATEALGPEGEL